VGLAVRSGSAAGDAGQPPPPVKTSVMFCDRFVEFTAWMVTLHLDALKSTKDDDMTGDRAFFLGLKKV
jgi:hypothetical protein